MNKCKRGYARIAHQVWDSSNCSYCNRTGYIRDIHGKLIPCSRCQEPDEPSPEQKLYDQGMIEYRRGEME